LKIHYRVQQCKNLFENNPLFVVNVRVACFYWLTV